MNNKHMKKIFNIRELQIKIAMSYQCIPVRIAKIKNNNNVGEDAEKLDPGGNIKCFTWQFLIN